MDTTNRRYLESLRKLCRILQGGTERLAGENDFGLDMPLDEIPERLPKSNALFPEFTLAKQAAAIEVQIAELTEQARTEGTEIPFERICSEQHLGQEERRMLAILFFQRPFRRRIRALSLLRLAITDDQDPLCRLELIAPEASLRRSGLVTVDSDYHCGGNVLLLEQYLTMTNEAFWTILGTRNYDEAEESTKEETRGSRTVLQVREPEVTFEHLVIPQEIRERLDEALWQGQNAEQVYERYGLNDRLPYGKAVAMLFYGPPGTGKTATSEAIASKLGKKIGIANYSRIYNCYVGESEKNVPRLFAEARKNDCVLLFDEADAMFSQRLNEDRAVDRMHNLMTNILMQQLERYRGVVILTTNREVVMDKAFERRLLLKLEFSLPDAELRAGIWRSFLEDCHQLSPDVDFDELGRLYELTGGKIKNAVIRATMRCARAGTPLTMDALSEAANEEASGALSKERRVGF